VARLRHALSADGETRRKGADELRLFPGIAVALLAIMLFPSVRAFTITRTGGSSQETKPQREKPSRTISVIAKDFDFEPAVIHMKVDEKVELDVTSSDKTHGMRISAFPDGAKVNTAPGLSFANGEDCWKLKKGEMVEIGIVPAEPGIYTFTCCKLCGSAHKKMKGQIIVDPQ
jgi:heme/copper-type cytochrome/quinol oxidase subunit 2